MQRAAADDYLLADQALARQLERAEGESNRDFVEARARVQPDSGACWIDVAGAYAMFDGISSPLTQSFGLGMFAPATASDFDRLERFFAERRAAVFHEVSPLADASALALLTSRGYRPIEFTSVMARPLPTPSPSAPSSCDVRVVAANEFELWAQTAAAGWGESPELAAFMLSLGRVSAARKNAVSFLGEMEGRPIAAGALSLHGKVALLAGASTVPSARRQGAQRALLEARLRYAAANGCTIAMMCAQPGSASQRNAEREGFRIAYTRIKWAL